MEQEVVEVHRDVHEREQTLRPLRLEERRQRRQRVAGLERRPEADLVVGEEGNDGRQDAQAQPDPASPWQVVEPWDAGVIQEGGVRRHGERQRRASQERGAAPPLVITAFGDKPAPRYRTPRTSWGEPDLQGVWSSDDTAGIPISRQEQYGDRLYLNEHEYAERAKQVERGVEQAENEATSSFRADFARRAFPQTSLIVDPADGRMPAYTPEGMKRPMPRGTYGPGPLDGVTDFSLYERCITRGIAGSALRVIYGNGTRIVQAPGVVAISYEMVHDTRLIYTDGRPHLPEDEAFPMWEGDSIGFWDGEGEHAKLVIWTTHVRSGIYHRNGPRYSDKLQAVEQIWMDKPDHLRLEMTVYDPVDLTRPWHVSRGFARDKTPGVIYASANPAGALTNVS